MQKQIEFMFGEMMSRFKDMLAKLETKVESGLGKKGREARKEESVVGNSIKGVEDDFYCGSEFCTHRNELEENKATAGDGEEIGEGDDWDQLLVQRRDWSHHWIVAAASTCFQWLRGCELVMAAGAEDNAAVEAGDGCVLSCSGDRGKICFGFVNGDGKGSVRLKVKIWWGGAAALGG
ncbi:hypothetical protein POTOM_013048 [Populus tomentosa]|uniref:Uncharacterized protein n=1 Tax=Populus tomentosa TaxID=118781 RepID=A0A8X8A1W5_POPTO|nr:hypothetical protein POTOM_013048 [Populus tomentosa]